MDRSLYGALRGAFVAGGVIAAILATGYFLQHPWAVSSWPWPDGRLSNIFVSSILAAIAVPLLWIGASGQFGGTAGGFLHLGVILGGAASVFFPLAAQRPDGPMNSYAIGAAFAAPVSFVLSAWAHRQPNRDVRPLTKPMRFWFVAYILVLIAGGIALVRTVPGIMPWPLKPETSMLYGWIFLAAICSFAYPLARPRVEYAAVGLWGFLAYDAVLIPPFLAHFKTVKAELMTSLVVYVVALVLTAIISIWYLFISPATRIVNRRSLG